MSALRNGLRRARPVWVDIAWAVFVGVNLAAMRLFPAWQTVPFLAIWVSLTAAGKCSAGAGEPASSLSGCCTARS
jgi:hypothetical protein